MASKICKIKKLSEATKATIEGRRTSQIKIEKFMLDLAESVE